MTTATMTTGAGTAVLAFRFGVAMTAQTAAALGAHAIAPAFIIPALRAA